MILTEPVTTDTNTQPESKDERAKAVANFAKEYRAEYGWEANGAERISFLTGYDAGLAARSPRDEDRWVSIATPDDLPKELTQAVWRHRPETQANTEYIVLTYDPSRYDDGDMRAWANLYSHYQNLDQPKENT